ESKFQNLFTAHVNGSAEAIFQLNFTTTSSFTGNRGNWLFAPPNSTTGISCGRVRASTAFYDQFKGTYLDDPRLDASFATGWKQIKTNNDNAFSYPYTQKNAGTPANKNIVKSDSIRYAALDNPTNPKISELSTEIKNAFTTRVGDHQG